MREMEKQFTPTEFKDYEDSIKAYRDLKNSIDFAEEKGIKIGHEQGLAEGVMRVAKNMKSAGMAIAEIIRLTGLSEEKIEEL